jgi:hypothetical protein
MSVQDRCTVCANVPQADKSFWMHLMVHLGDKAQVDARFISFGYSANFDSR